MSVIHFSEKYKQSLMDGFNKASETDALFTHELDTEFSGVNTVHVTSLKTEPLQDYNRQKEVGTGSRYGTTKEVGDEFVVGKIFYIIIKIVSEIERGDSFCAVV